MMKSTVKWAGSRAWWACLLMGTLLFMANACSIRLISDYDEATDKAVTHLQKKVDTFLVAMQRKAGTTDAAYEKNIQFYDEVRVDISAIKVRAAARPMNEITIKQINLLGENVDKLESLNKLGFQSPEELIPLRTAFDISFSAILKLELAKKRGE